MSKRIIIPAYSPYPDASWEVLFPHAADIAYVILNVDSGVGVGTDPVYVAMADRLNRAGVACLGYVPSTYGQRSLDGIKTEIRQWFERYKVAGIFIDEMDSKASSLPYYKRIKAACGTAQLVTNPGTVPDESYRELDAIICVAETDQERYLEKEFPAWTNTIGGRAVAHIVFGVTDAAKVLSKIDANQADYFYITTTVPKPGASGPEFNIPETIWPPSEATPAPPPTQPTENTATMLLIAVAGALPMPVGSTLADVPEIVVQQMVKIDQLKSQVAQLQAQSAVRLGAVDDDQLVEELRRRLTER